MENESKNEDTRQELEETVNIRGDKDFKPAFISIEDAENASKAAQEYILSENSKENRILIPLVYKDGKPFQKCPECAESRLYSSPGMLKRHLLLQHHIFHNKQKEEFYCKFCSYFSFDQQCLNYHIALNHQPTVELKRLTYKDVSSKFKVTCDIQVSSITIIIFLLFFVTKRRNCSICSWKNI